MDSIQKSAMRSDESKLPLELVVLIMSFLTMKEAGRTSVLSRSWNYAWRSLPVLSFQVDSSSSKELFIEIRSGFAKWVNSVLEAYLGAAIDGLKVTFDLDVKCESDIDKWLVFALSRHVKRLEFDFTPMSSRSLIDSYSWPIEGRLSYLGLHRKLASLRSLRLKFVNVTPEDIECILLSCNVLEDLCITGGCMNLTDIKLSHKSLPLKHLEVSDCPRMMCIDILAPKLVSLTYHGHPIKLHIQDASLLSKIAIGIGNGDYFGEVLTYACYFLSKYFSQLEYLSWHLPMNHPGGAHHFKWNMGISNPPIMNNLIHLVLHVEAKCDDTLLGWASLIEASPVLERITLEISGRARGRGSLNRNIVKHQVRPLRCLKTLELVDFYGVPMELEFVNFVVENSVSLQTIFLLPRRSPCAMLPPEFLRRKLEIISDFSNMKSKGVVVKRVTTKSMRD